MVHKRPQVTSDPSGIHSDWGKVLTVAEQEQCSVVSKREGVGGWEGGGDSLPLLSSSLSFLSLPSYKPRSCAESQHARNKQGSSFFHLGYERNWAWQRNYPAPEHTHTHTQETSSELSSHCFVAYRSEKREREREEEILGHREAFIHTVRQSVVERDRGFWNRKGRSWKFGGKQETYKQEDNFWECHRHDCISWYVRAHTHICQKAWMIVYDWIVLFTSVRTHRLQPPTVMIHRWAFNRFPCVLYFYFLSFPYILSLVYEMLPLPQSLAEFLRRRTCRETLPLSSL